MSAIKYQATKQFWENRAERFRNSDWILATTLQDDLPAVSDYRDHAEKKHFKKKISLNKNMRVLDLGGGSGRWSMFAAPLVREVTLVDFSSGMLEIAKAKAASLGIDNIRFVESSIVDFQPSGKFDIIIFSGVLMYINDADLASVCRMCYECLSDDGKIFVREGVDYIQYSTKTDVYSEMLDDVYSVVWRRPDDYMKVFGDFFFLEYENDAFPFLLPVFFAKRFIPSKYHRSVFLRGIMRSALLVQSWFDGLLLSCRPLLAMYHKWLGRQEYAIGAHMFIFSKAQAKEQKKIERILAAENASDYEKHSPFYLLDTQKVKDNLNAFVSLFNKVKPRIYYSVKTNYESGLLRFIRKELNLGADVGSSLDMELAEKAGFSNENIIVDGYYKTDSFLEETVKKKVFLLNVESWDELRRLSLVAQKNATTIDVGLRLNVSRRWGDWRNLLTDRKQKVFGLLERELLDNIDELKGMSGINVVSLMTHTHKSFTQPADFTYVLDKMFKFIVKLRDHDIRIRSLNLGGGFPEKYTSAYSLSEFAEVIDRKYALLSERFCLRPELYFEIGKALVGNAGYLIGKVLDIRGRDVIVDFSRNDFGFYFPFKKRRFIMPNKNIPLKGTQYRICSSTLEKYDIASESIVLNEPEVGDWIVMCDVGAYSIPLSTQFTRLRRPIFQIDGNSSVRMIRRAEEFSDISRLQDWS